LCNSYSHLGNSYGCPLGLRQNLVDLTDYRVQDIESVQVVDKQMMLISTMAIRKRLHDV